MFSNIFQNYLKHKFCFIVACGASIRWSHTCLLHFSFGIKLPQLCYAIHVMTNNTQLSLTVELQVYSAYLEESSMEKNTYSPESIIPSSSAASNSSRMVVELAHITTTETKKIQFLFEKHYGIKNIMGCMHTN